MCDVREKQKALIRKFIFDNSETLDDQDRALQIRADSAIRLRYQHGWTQTFCVGIDDEGNIVERPNSEQKIASNSMCAERMTINEAEFAQRLIQTFVTVRRQRPDEGTAVHVVSPCGSCREAIFHHNPKAKMICWFGGDIKEYRKVAIDFLLPLVYKEKERPTNGETMTPNKFET